ncbi:MAG TPA: branched-chain amino acid ABC transporter substrate-binding protein [Burkholderiales bacterium]|nr:branched-chain amino acid ABC transporter substrate-binding protein [Burkholderiales bacterium]
MVRRRLLNAGLGLAVAVFIAACGQEPPPPPPPAAKVEAPKPPPEVVVKIGQVSPLTGPQAHLGKDNDNGARLAIEEMNAKGLVIGGAKVKFELVSEDDQADPKTGTVVAQKLVDAKVAGVIGHLNSGTTIPASKIYSDAGIPQISPSATAVAVTAQGYKSIFRTMANDAQQGKVLGEYAVGPMSAKRIAIIDDRTAYGQGLADEFEKAAKAGGATIVGREYTNDKATDFRAILTGIKGKKPDLVFYGGMDAQAGPMAAQLQSLAVKAKFLGGDGAQSQEFIKLAGPAAEGVIASSPGLPLEKMPGSKGFSDKFTGKYGQIQIYAPYAYDATMTLIEAMQKANSTDPAKYLPELAKTSRQGVTGPIGFDEKGDLRNGPITLYVVKSGKWESLATVGGEAAAAAAAPAAAPAAPTADKPAAAPAPAAPPAEKK